MSDDEVPKEDIKIAKNALTRKISGQTYGRKQQACRQFCDQAAESLSTNLQDAESAEYKTLVERLDANGSRHPHPDGRDEFQV